MGFLSFLFSIVNIWLGSPGSIPVRFTFDSGSTLMSETSLGIGWGVFSLFRKNEPKYSITPFLFRSMINRLHNWKKALVSVWNHDVIYHEMYHWEMRSMRFAVEKQQGNLWDSLNVKTYEFGKNFRSESAVRKYERRGQVNTLASSSSCSSSLCFSSLLLSSPLWEFHQSPDALMSSRVSRKKSRLSILVLEILTIRTY